MLRYYVSSIVIVSAFAALLCSCNDPNAAAPLENKAHEQGWVLVHDDFAAADLNGCILCHGADFSGSNNAVSCFSCHYGGPPFLVHPAAWTEAFVDHREYVRVNGFSSCALSACHGTNPFVSGGVTAPSCGTASYTDKNGITHGCHSGHITGASWLLPNAHPASAIDDLSSCLFCHDPAVANPPVPACRDCHTASDPLMVLGSCASCHNNPPDGRSPAGNVRPNTAGEHNKHVVEEGFGCSVCHQDYGSGTLGHWYPDPGAPADVSFESGITLTYNGSTCNGDCHGENHSNETW